MDTYSGPRICVAGTHGKTTTTAMLAEALLCAGRDPTVLVGGDYAPFGGTLRLGSSGVFVTEACEAFRSFHSLHPDIGVVTNIEPDHLDCYGDAAGVLVGFQTFVAGIRTGGALVIRSEGAAEQAVAARAVEAGLRVWRFGIEKSATTDVWASGLRHADGCAHFVPVVRGDRAPLGEVTLRVPGEHNVMNGLAVVAAATLAGADPSAAAEGLSRFGGVGRRFEVIGVRDGVIVVDDYSHHPTEIRAAIAAARGKYPGRYVVAVFQPHLYSRTRDFMDGFGQALAGADAVILTSIYPAREEPIEGVTPTALAARVAAAAPSIPLHVESSLGRVPALISRMAHPGDIVLILGAGDVREAGERFVSGCCKETT
jgi:UDP-N-acetylmuramate--alanine ligase